MTRTQQIEKEIATLARKIARLVGEREKIKRRARARARRAHTKRC